MQTLKTLVVLAVLAIVGYGLYLGLNGGFNEPPQIPDWIQQQISPAQSGGPVPPEVDLGGFSSPAAPPTSHAPPDFPPSGSAVPPSAGSGGPPPAAARYPGMLAHPPPEEPTAAGPPPDGSAAGAAGTIPGSDPAAAGAAGAGDPLASGLAQPLAATYPPPSGGVPGDTTTEASGGLPSAADAAASSDPPTAADPSPPAGNTSVGDRAFQETMAAARQQLASGQFSTALLALSMWYEDPSLAPEDHQQLVGLLDQVAGSAIYSRQHLLEPAHVVTAGESLQEVAARYKVPAGLLAKINGVAVDDPLTAGQELKVVRGPFYGVIDTNQQILTLWVANRYAGRFPAHVGPEFEQIVGTFVVKQKMRTHPAHDNQPFIQLGMGYPGEQPPTPTVHQLAIAGMANPEDARGGQVAGRVGVSTRDADDLVDILSEGSRITIRR